MKEIKVTKCKFHNWDEDCDKCIGFWHKIIEESPPDILFKLPKGCIDSSCIIDTGIDTYLLREVPEFKVGDRVHGPASTKATITKVNADLTIRLRWDDCENVSVIRWRPDQLKKIAPQFKVGDRVRVKVNVNRRTLGSKKTSHKLDRIEGKVRTVSDDAITVEYDWDGETYFTVIFPDQLEKVEEFQSADFDMCFIDQPPENDADKMRVLMNSLPSWMPEEAKPMKQIRVTECREARQADCSARMACLNKWHPAEKRNNNGWRFDGGRKYQCFAAPLGGVNFDCYIQKYELRDAPDSTPDREEVSEVAQKLYHVIVWGLDKDGSVEDLVTHDFLPAKSPAKAEIKMMQRPDFKEKNPDDFYCQVLTLG